MRFSLFFGVVVELAFLAGCQPKPPNSLEHAGETLKREGEPDVVSVSNEDVAMNAAIQKARSTINVFIAALRSPKTGQHNFSIKKRFAVRKGGEHIWLSHVTYIGKLFYGRLSDEPVEVTSVKMGDPVTVAPQDISDWMFTTNGKLSGGYTIRVLYDKMSPVEKKQFRQESKLIF